MTIEEVIAELEKASEGSQRLDVLVCCAAFDISFERGEEYLRWANQPFMGVTKPHEFYETLRSFTRSLDAAMSLVPEGAVWHVMNDYGLPGRAKIIPSGKTVYDANIYDAENYEDGPILFQGDGASPALAICIAALKARSRQS